MSKDAFKELLSEGSNESKLGYWAQRLEGREFGEELSDAEIREAREDGVVIVHMASGDSVEFRGAIELSSYEDRIYLTREGTELEDCSCECHHWQLAQEDCEFIDVLEGEGGDDFQWRFETYIPHKTFGIYETETGTEKILYDYPQLFLQLLAHSVALEVQGNLSRLFHYYQSFQSSHCRTQFAV